MRQVTRPKGPTTQRTVGHREPRKPVLGWKLERHLPASQLPDRILGLWEVTACHSLSVLCFIFIRLAFHTPEMLNVSFAEFETSYYSVSSSPFIKCTASPVLALLPREHSNFALSYL